MENIDEINTVSVKADDLPDSSAQTSRNSGDDFYTLKELAEWDDAACGKIEKTRISQEMLSAFERLKNLSEEQAANKENVISSLMTPEDMRKINDCAKAYTEKVTGVPFNPEDTFHRDYFEYVKSVMKEERAGELGSAELELSLKKRYGRDFDNVEKEARRVFENMAFKDAASFLRARKKCDFETVSSFYDDIYAKIKNGKSGNDMIFPPKSIHTGTGGLKIKKEAAWSDFI